VVAEVSAEGEEEKARKQQRKEKYVAEKKRRKEAAAAKEAEKKEEVPPLMTSHVLMYTNRVKEEISRATLLINEMKADLKLPYLKDVFVYYYGMKRGEVNGKNKSELIALLADNVASNTAEVTQGEVDM